MRGQRAIIATAALAAAVAVVIGVTHPWGGASWWLVPAMALATALAEWSSARMVIGRQGLTFELTDAVLAFALLVLPGSWLILSVALGTGLEYGRRRRQRLKLAFNISNYTCSAALAVATTSALGGGVVAVALGVIVFAVANHLLTGFAVAMAGGRRYRQVLGNMALLAALITTGSASVGILGGWLAMNQPLGLLSLVVPVGLLWWSCEQQTERSAEARLFAEIARGQETIAGTSVDTSAQIVVAASARVFGGAEVEMLLRHPDGVLHYLGDENGVSERVRAEADAFGAPWVLRAMAARGASSGVEDRRPFVSAVLGDVERPLAVLVVRRPERAGGFTRADIQLADVLATQAESWLSVADLTAQADEVRGEVEAYRAAGRVLGDIGADTAPALVVLRESADRLARLAKGFGGPDPVSEIVEELHAVERAVASLLGAVAMAQPNNRPNDRPISEWTTTGRLESADTR